MHKLVLVVLAAAALVAGCGGSSGGSRYWREDFSDGSPSLYMSVIVDGQNVSGWAKYNDGTFQHYAGTANSDGTFDVTAYTGETLSMDGDTMTASYHDGNGSQHW